MAILCHARLAADACKNIRILFQELKEEYEQPPAAEAAQVAVYKAAEIQEAEVTKALAEMKVTN